MIFARLVIVENVDVSVGDVAYESCLRFQRMPKLPTFQVV